MSRIRLGQPDAAAKGECGCSTDFGATPSNQYRESPSNQYRESPPIHEPARGVPMRIPTQGELERIHIQCHDRRTEFALSMRWHLGYVGNTRISGNQPSPQALNL